MARPGLRGGASYPVPVRPFGPGLRVVGANTDLPSVIFLPAFFLAGFFVLATMNEFLVGRLPRWDAKAFARSLPPSDRQYVR